MRRQQSPPLTEGPVTRHLVRLTLPMIMGMLSMTIFHLTDTYFIGQLGKNELAAISFTFPVIMVLNSIALGLGVGASSVISRTIGEGNSMKVRRLATDALFLAVIIVAFVVAAGELTIYPLFRLLGAPEDILPLTAAYMRIWYIGVVFVVVPMTGNHIIRATGDMKTPGLIMTAAALVNMVLDPIFIFGFGPFPGMGIAGGAIATVIGRAMSMVIALAVIIFREKLITLDRVPFREVLSSWKKILFVGIPAALSNLIIPVTMGVITRLVASFGTSAVAGFGVATRLEMLVMLVIRALASVMIPFSGQNWGAGLLDRVKTALKSSYIIAAVWSLVLFVLLFIFGKPVVSLFNKDPQIVETAVLYLRIVAASYSFQGILLVSVASLNALNKPIHSILVSLFHAAGLYVPLALAGTALWGLKGIFIAAFAANTIAGIGAALTAFRQTNHV